MGFESKYGIRVAPTGLTGSAARSFKQQTRKHLSWIDGTTVGRHLLRGIGWHARNNPGNLLNGRVEIRPYTGGKCNATASNATSGATGWSQPTVTYSPKEFHHSGACYGQLKQKKTNRGLYPDELLFHELVHAMRGASAQFKGHPTSGGLVNYDGTEEFIAVLVTNIYVSDPSNGSKTGLRKDHHGFTPLEEYLAGSIAFYNSSKNAFTLVDQFCRENPSFTLWLAKVKAPFNPIKAYYDDPAACRKASNSAVAMARDGDWFGLMWKVMTGT